MIEDMYCDVLKEQVKYYKESSKYGWNDGFYRDRCVSKNILALTLEM